MSRHHMFNYMEDVSPSLRKPPSSHWTLPIFISDHRSPSFNNGVRSPVTSHLSDYAILLWRQPTRPRAMVVLKVRLCFKADPSLCLSRTRPCISILLGIITALVHRNEIPVLLPSNDLILNTVDHRAADGPSRYAELRCIDCIDLKL